jgi:hypothetical protein
MVIAMTPKETNSSTKVIPRRTIFEALLSGRTSGGNRAAVNRVTPGNPGNGSNIVTAESTAA